MTQLYHVLRQEFASDLDISNARCASIPYVDAVIDESLRLYSPMAAHLPRVVPLGGAIVAGSFLPENVSIYLVVVFI
jgi:ribosomal protein S8